MRIGDAKQSYEADEAIWTSQTQKLWLGGFLLVLLVFPFIVDSYLLYLGCLVGIAVISTTGLNILTGFTGLISLGQAGFIARNTGKGIAAIVEAFFGILKTINQVLSRDDLVGVNVFAYDKGLAFDDIFLLVGRFFIRCCCFSQNGNVF